MHRSLLFSQALLLAGIARASPLGAKHSLEARYEEIQWRPCNFSSSAIALPTLCANLTVPLDYTDKSSQETWPLELIKVSALKGPSKGTVFLNYGGPGDSGLTSLPAYALYQHA